MDKKQLTGLTKQRVKVAPYSTLKIDYNDTKPNYYRVQNSGKSPLYCGTSHMPTSNNYDFMCNAESMKMYAEPFKRNTLYIFNPSGDEIAVNILSFSADFDPLTLALSEISLDLPTADIGVATTINSFETSLPTGDNKIGRVEVTNSQDYNAKLESIVSAINNKTFNADISGDVYATVDNSDVVSAIDDLKTITSGEGDRIVSAVNGINLDNSDVVSAINGINLDNSDVVSAINGINLDNSDVVSALSAVSALLKPKNITSIGEDKSLTGYGTIEPKAGTGKKITCIDFIANDGTSDVVLEYAGVTVTIKPNEVLNGVRCYCDSIMICENNGKAVDVRYLVTVEEV